MKKLTGRLRIIWYSDTEVSSLNPLIMVLYLLSLPYRAAVALRNLLYNSGIWKQNKLPCTVISIGNITVGGTGKTPTVVMLAKLLKDKGYRPAILSRGYGGTAKSPVNIVSDGSRILMEHGEAGDEPVLIAKSTEGIPVLTGPKRSITGRFAIENLQADILILDDAFQHRSIFRDIDLVLLDREQPFGNGFLLPRGPLREPLNALNRAHVIIWKDRVLDGRFPKYCDQGIGTFHSVLSGYMRPRDIIQGRTGTIYPVEYLKGKKVCAFAGIGAPESLRNTIESLDGIVVSFIDFPDHYGYTESDISDIQRKSADSSAEIIITTEKDGVRLTGFPDFLKDVFLLRVEMEMLPSREEFEALILDKIK